MPCPVPDPLGSKFMELYKLQVPLTKQKLQLEGPNRNGRDLAPRSPQCEFCTGLYGRIEKESFYNGLFYIKCNLIKNFDPHTACFSILSADSGPNTTPSDCQACAPELAAPGPPVSSAGKEGFNNIIQYNRY